MITAINGQRRLRSRISTYRYRMIFFIGRHSSSWSAIFTLITMFLFCFTSALYSPFEYCVSIKESTFFSYQNDFSVLKISNTGTPRTTPLVHVITRQTRYRYFREKNPNRTYIRCYRTYWTRKPINRQKYESKWYSIISFFLHHRIHTFSSLKPWK